ncbi:uncharacterized protein LOC119680723 isoform X2 [Teleopsis dalmanni]|nr:uncharacterized protein LOC119680723 isoform X2 [Teleopsis dalmanni]
MPYNVSQFTSVAIWPYSRKYARDLDFVNKTTDLRVNGGEYGEDSSGRKIHSKDFTAGELYRSFEDLLVSYDFHETCLLRSVCELARHPFAEEQQNILTEVLTFFLTPSLHESFAKNEDLYREVYEEAEQCGFLGENCSEIYNECKQDLISAVTKIVT